MRGRMIADNVKAHRVTQNRDDDTVTIVFYEGSPEDSTTPAFQVELTSEGFAALRRDIQGVKA